MANYLSIQEKNLIRSAARYVGAKVGRKQWSVDTILSEAAYLAKTNTSESYLPLPVCRNIVAAQNLIDFTPKGDQAYRLWKREMNDAKELWSDTNV